MSGQIRRPEEIASGGGVREFRTDVLVLGGGPAGTWAAISAAQRGASVILADKGFCGTSGATAPSGTGVWYVQPDPAKREAAMASREVLGGYLQDRRWMARTLNQTFENVDQLARWGYPFRDDGVGFQRYGSVMGPEYMRLMRKRTKQAGVKIFDHSPALELLQDENGAVVGASGLFQQAGERWNVHAGAVILATGGCAFLSKALGCNVLTGDGLLMGAEVGAELSGMEFSNAYAMSLAEGSVTKTRFYDFAEFTDANGDPIPGAQSKGGRSVIARWLMSGPVYASLVNVDAETQQAMRRAQPNFFLPLDRSGINPFTDRFPVTLRLEGTVRGTGGLRLVDESCATSVEGLYAAGDAATRELVCGAFTGGGSHNAAWAMSSGYWAGAGAASHARTRRALAQPSKVIRAGKAALAEQSQRSYDPLAVTQAVQDEVFPYDRNYFRSELGLKHSLERLDRLWRKVESADKASVLHVAQSRQAAAMVATARWMYRSALERDESRGMARRVDRPQQDPGPRYYVRSGGLSEVWTRRDLQQPEARVLEAAE
ncbi:MAG TPA: FAD-binding protein [Beijerinckiaceae bacterium]|jgi:succinate dehydrogenase/fumarate reductase flavoprotein subunit|nr:FAD-binding protein [Beijerinckiaceae bacterium]